MFVGLIIALSLTTQIRHLTMQIQKKTSLLSFTRWPCGIQTAVGEWICHALSPACRCIQATSCQLPRRRASRRGSLGTMRCVWRRNIFLTLRISRPSRPLSFGRKKPIYTERNFASATCKQQYYYTSDIFIFQKNVILVYFTAIFVSGQFNLVFLCCISDVLLQNS